MYKIIGGDGREYGPATADELRLWIADGRLSRLSLVQIAGTAEWKRLSAYAEFAPALAAQVGHGPPPPPQQHWLADTVARRPEVKIAGCLAQSWSLLHRHLSLLLGASLLVWGIETLCQGFLLGVGDAMFMVLRGVFYGGLSMVFLNCLRGRPASIAGVFGGFRTDFAQLLLAGFISSLAVFFATCCLVLPAIYLFVAWLFCVPLVADKRLEFWSAMELSRRTVTPVWFQVCALFVLAFLPTLLINGFIQAKLCAASIPVVQSVTSLGAALDFNHLSEAMAQATKAAKIPPGLVIAARLVFLVNLPFGLGALLAAYEDLFHPGPASSS